MNLSSFFSFLKKFKKKRVWIPTAIGILVLGSFVYGRLKPEVKEFSSEQVKRIDLVQSVEETGSVAAQTDVSYGWESSGRVAKVEKKVGDVVKTGDLIATLENAQQQSRLSEGYARLSAAQARLNLELVGPSPEDIALSQTKVDNAFASLEKVKAAQAASVVSGENAIASAEKTLEEAVKKIEIDLVQDEQDISNEYEDAVQDAKSALTDGLDAMVVIADLQEDYALFIHNDIQIGISALVGQTLVGTLYSDQLLTYTGGARGVINSLSSSSDRVTIEAALATLVSALQKLKTATDSVLSQINASFEATATDKTTLNTARASLDSAIASVVAAKQGISGAILAKGNALSSNTVAKNTAEQSLENAKKIAEQNTVQATADILVAEASLKQAQATHAEFIAPPRGVDVASLRADVAQQAASVRGLQDDFKKSQLIALADGVISKLDVKKGETVTAGQEVFGIISDTLKVDVDISETDVAKVQIGDPAQVTLDAFGAGTVFDGVVIDIDPAQTEVSGVVYYKTTVSLPLKEDNEQGLRPGMTANVRIVTDKKDGVLAIPRRAVLTKDDTKIVRVLKNIKTGDFEEKTVELGLSGDEGLVEVISGLSEGEEIITFLKDEK